MLDYGFLSLQTRHRGTSDLPLCYRVHLADISEESEARIQQNLVRLAEKADEMDNMMVEQFGCEFSAYSKQDNEACAPSVRNTAPAQTGLFRQTDDAACRKAAGLQRPAPPFSNNKQPNHETFNYASTSSIKENLTSLDSGRSPDHLSARPSLRNQHRRQTDPRARTDNDPDDYCRALHALHGLPQDPSGSLSAYRPRAELSP